MKKLMLTALVLMAAALIALPTTAQAANLLSNGGFELSGGGTGSGAADNWTTAGEFYRVDWNDFLNFSGPGTKYGIQTGNGNPGSAYQEVSGITAGQEYNFSIYASRDSGDRLNYFMTLAWYNGDTHLEDATLNPALPVGNLRLLDKANTLFTLSDAAPVTANKVRVTFGTSATSETGKWDEANFEPIPEPTSLLLLGSGLLGLFGISRKKSVK